MAGFDAAIAKLREILDRPRASMFAVDEIWLAEGGVLLAILEQMQGATPANTPAANDGDIAVAILKRLDDMHRILLQPPAVIDTGDSAMTRAKLDTIVAALEVIQRQTLAGMTSEEVAAWIVIDEAAKRLERDRPSVTKEKDWKDLRAALEVIRAMRKGMEQ